jgi:hypothetical protein
LDHVIILYERQLRAVLAEYVRYFNHLRPHQGLRQATPVESAPSLGGESLFGYAFAKEAPGSPDAVSFPAEDALHVLRTDTELRHVTG